MTLYATDSCCGFTFGDTNFKFVLGVTHIFSVFRYQHFGISNAKLWRWESNPTPVPNSNGFAPQWNIGLRIDNSGWSPFE